MLLGAREALALIGELFRIEREIAQAPTQRLQPNLFRRASLGQLSAVPAQLLRRVH